jgi:hypothetical protein
MKKPQFFLLSLFVMALVSCNSNSPSEKSGNQVSDEQVIGDISKLKISGIFNLIIIQSDNPSLRIEGDENLVSMLKVNQQGDLLELTLEGERESLFGNFDLDVYVTVPNLTELEFEGVGNIKNEGTLTLETFEMTGEGIGNIQLDMDAKSIDARFNLMGNLKFKGTVEEIYLSNEGIGNVEASDMIAQNMTLISSGLGKVAVHCVGDLSITVNGIGAVSYIGFPNVIKEEINGMGSVSRN